MPLPFTIFPAIDLRHGQVVRLQYGDPQRQTVFGSDPAGIAQQWITAGADWLHVVNLDGALDEAGAANWTALPTLTRLGARVQFGGGVRTLADIERALAAGASRVILGTAAVENPALVAQALARFGPERIVAAIDARAGRVKTRGWQQDGGQTPAGLGRQLQALGLATIIHTDISRDGVLSGVNAAASAALAQATGLHVIASGGVAGLPDVRRCAALAAQGVVGVITGRAIYDGTLDLRQALAEIHRGENYAG